MVTAKPIVCRRRPFCEGERVRFGIIGLPRSVAATVADARLAEAAGFLWFGVADSQSVYRELYATAALCAARCSPTIRRRGTAALHAVASLAGRGQ